MNSVTMTSGENVTMLKSCRFLIVVAAFALAAMPAPSQEPKDARAGRAEYIQFACHQCHGYEGQGPRRTGPKLAPNPLAYEVFSVVVRQPPAVMPAYSPKVLSEEKLKLIYAYMVSIPPAPAVSSIPELSDN